MIFSRIQSAERGRVSLRQLARTFDRGTSRERVRFASARQNVTEEIWNKLGIVVRKQRAVDTRGSTVFGRE